MLHLIEKPGLISSRLHFYDQYFMYEKSINELEWMGEDTRVQALDKLSKFTPKIGYPDKWKDYSALEVKSDELDFSELHRRSAESVFEVCGLTFYDFVVVSKGTILKTSSGKLQRNASLFLVKREISTPERSFHKES